MEGGGHFGDCTSTTIRRKDYWQEVEAAELPQSQRGVMGIEKELACFEAGMGVFMYDE